ncbi:hypothetical protein D3C76_243980 [compost metagenome]
MEKFHYNKITKESGFSLIEVLAALVILSVVTLALTAFFVNSMAYAKGNQNKTVMVNLARNALVYMEKQAFYPIAQYFNPDSESDGTPSDVIACDLVGETPDCSDIEGLVTDPSALSGVFHPEINDIKYALTIEYQRDLHNSDTMLNSSNEDTKKMAKLLIPIKVIVKRQDGREGNRNKTEVEGYITSERIR